MTSDRLQLDIRELIDQLSIGHLNSTHSRSIDRADAVLLDEVYAGNGEVRYGFFAGRPREFSKTITGLMAGGPVTMHRSSSQVGQGQRRCRASCLGVSR